MVTVTWVVIIELDRGISDHRVATLEVAFDWVAIFTVCFGYHQESDQKWWLFHYNYYNSKEDWLSKICTSFNKIHRLVNEYCKSEFHLCFLKFSSKIYCWNIANLKEWCKLLKFYLFYTNHLMIMHRIENNVESYQFWISNDYSIRTRVEKKNKKNYFFLQKNAQLGIGLEKIFFGTEKRKVPNPDSYMNINNSIRIIRFWIDDSIQSGKGFESW